MNKEKLLEKEQSQNPISQNKHLSTFTKYASALFFLFNALIFSDNGLIIANYDSFIKDYNLTQKKFSLISIFSSFGHILSSIILLKLMKKISLKYKTIIILSIMAKAISLMSMHFKYSYFLILILRFINGSIDLFLFSYFISWFKEKSPRPLYGILIEILAINLGNLFGYLLSIFDINKDWRNNFKLLGFMNLICSFLLMLFSENIFKIHKNIYLKEEKKNLDKKYYDENNTIFNMKTINEINRKLQNQEIKNSLYDVSLEKEITDNIINHGSSYLKELQKMIKNRKYILFLVSLSLFHLLNNNILFWFNDYLINNLGVKQKNERIIFYSIICFFGPLLGMLISQTIFQSVYKKKLKLFLILLLILLILSAISALIQMENFLEYNNLLFLIYVALLFFLLPNIIVFLLKNTWYTFKRENFVILIFVNSIIGNLIGNLIYTNFYDIRGVGSILDCSWLFTVVLGLGLYFEWSTANKILDIENKKKKGNKTNKKLRTTVTSDIMGQELQDIDENQDRISVDDSENKIDNSKDKENEYSLKEYIEK